MNLEAASGNAQRLLQLIESGNEQWVRLQAQSLIHGLLNAIVDELSGKVFLMVRSDRSKFYDKPTEIFSVKLRDKFKSTSRDMDEACKCLALGRYTACVFHLMRIMEHLVQDFASGIGAEVTHNGKPIEIRYAEWHQIEEAIQAKLKDVPKGERKE